MVINVKASKSSNAKKKKNQAALESVLKTNQPKMTEFKHYNVG